MSNGVWFVGLGNDAVIAAASSGDVITFGKYFEGSDPSWDVIGQLKMQVYFKKKLKSIYLILFK